MAEWDGRTSSPPRGSPCVEFIHETEIGEEGEPFDMALYAVTVEGWRDRVRR